MYLVDSGTLKALINNDLQVLQNFEKWEDQIVMSSIVAMECYNSAINVKNDKILNFYKTLFNSYKTLSFGNEDGLVFAKINYELVNIDKAVGEFELMIASQCLAQNCTLVSGNPERFESIKNLSVINWISSN